MHMCPYLSFNGQCREAFMFYAECLDGRVEAIFTYGESPMADQAPPGWLDRVMHAQLLFGDKVLMGSDSPPEQYQASQGIAVMLGVDSPDEAERIFASLSEQGAVNMPMQETFWAERFGIVVDRFGTPWMINCLKSGCADEGS